jgi:serine/threonine protein kinase/thioredoxin-like negative regulator of GroEL
MPSSFGLHYSFVIRHSDFVIFPHMTPARLQTVEEIFHAALDQESDRVGAFLDAACEGDEALRRKVEALLASHQRAGSFIETTVAGIATRIIENEQADLLVDQTIGHYKISKRIGTGGMGDVYLATDVTAGRKAALKLLPMRFTSDAERLKRFQQEARAVVGLNHPNILTVYEIGEDRSIHYIASELIEGETLRQRLMRGRMELRQAVDVAIQVATALAAAHEAGIVHRDIKPENIMLRPDGYVKVLDFGIAKLAESAFAKAAADGAESMTLAETNLGSISGTVRYMSPEQARGAPIDKRTDIWSLGVVLYEMIAKHAPFTGDTSKEVMSSIVEKEPPPLTSYVAHPPAELRQIISKTLRKNREERYHTALELLEALKGLRHKLEFKAELKRSTATPKLAAFILLAAIVVVAFFSFRMSRHKVVPLPPFPERSIAVLPFLDLSQAKDQEYFCDGMSEEILDALAKVDGLRVAARTSSFSFKGKNPDVSDLGKKLNVENVVEGSVRRDGNRVRISAQLVNARNGLRLWSETYERELQGVFALQDEITRAIVDALKIKLAISLPAHEQRNTEGYDLYLQGLYFSNKGSEEDLRKALSFFQRSLEKDPTFSRAWTGIAKVWFFLGDVHVKPLDAYPQSKAAALKAIALDENDAEAHCYLGEAKRIMDWDVTGEDAELNRALQLDPNSAAVHLFLALLPLFRGELKEGLGLVLEAEKLDPLSPIISYVATAAYLADKRIDEAIIAGQRTQRLDPHYFYLDSNLAAAYREKGDFAQAIALYTKAQEEQRFPSSGLAITYARMGQQAEAKKILDQLLQERQTRYVSAQTIAAVYVAFGEKEEAFRWLERAAAEHCGTLQWIAFLPEFGALHSDARFPQFLRRIGVAHGSILAITEATLTANNDPNAQAHFTLKVGVKPRPGTQNGHVVRIKVDFYDRTKDNKMKPTNARTSYSWLTASDDWTDATPKLLAATYVRPKNQSPSPDGRQYGGFIVGVYFDGQLQDMRASPPELVTSFPAPDQLAPSTSVPP